MTATPSILSFAAAGLYVLVACSCLCAAVMAQRSQQQSWLVRSWLLIGVFFVLLAILRIWSLEEILRDELRTILKADGAYTERRAFQRPLAASVVGFVILASFFWAYRTVRFMRGRRNLATVIALASAATMLGLVALRLISLSPLDAVLFRGPRLNWFIDLGTSGIVFCAAVYVSFRVSRAARAR